MNRLLEGVPRHGLAALALVAAAALAAPLFASDYVVRVLLVVLYFAFLGQTWNIMMGFAGQLSLGHALYVGLGAYAAAALYVKFGVSPWLGMFAGVAVSGLVGLIIGFLGFRFDIRGVYFALLTIAFAEFTRILFDHWTWVEGSGGLFIPVAGGAQLDLFNLRGGPVMFYYVLLALTAALLLLCRALLNSRLGYYWQAIREDQEAAQALGINVFRYKLYATVLSAALTAVAGVIYAFMNNNLFPEQVFGITNSIELILAPIVGGVGTLIGPLLGAAILTPLGEVMTWLAEWLPEWLGLPFKLNGLKQVFYGLCVVCIVLFLPGGVWPWLRRLLRLDMRPADGE